MGALRVADSSFLCHIPPEFAQIVQLWEVHIVPEIGSMFKMF